MKEAAAESRNESFVYPSTARVGVRNAPKTKKGNTVPQQAFGHNNNAPNPKNKSQMRKTAMMRRDPNHLDVDDLRRKIKELEEKIREENGIGEASPERVKEEIETAKEGFSQIIHEEKERIKRIAEEENERVMEIARQDDFEITCPLCLEDMKLIYEPQDAPMMMNCCGVRLCRTCCDQWLDRHNTMKNFKCFSCRRDASSGTVENLVLTGGQDAKGMALVSLGIDLHNKGKSRKAYKNFHQAAELGNGLAHAAIAKLYFDGKVAGYPQSTTKARELAQKGSDQGNSDSNMLLARMYEREGKTNDPEFLRLISLAAYQGEAAAMVALGNYFSPSKEASKKNVTLSLYWTGKVMEIKNQKYESCPKIFIALLDAIMKQFWHIRGDFANEPLTGCSHIPLCTWIRKNRLIEGHDVKVDKLLGDFVTNPCSRWMKICVVCRKDVKKQNLKICGNCQSFAYCSKECQVKHWKYGHKVDCKGHWIEEFFPNLRNPKAMQSQGLSGRGGVLLSFTPTTIMD